MDQIVSGIAEINFQQHYNFHENLNQNTRAPEKENCNIWNIHSVNMTSDMSGDVHNTYENDSESDEKPELTDSDNVDGGKTEDVMKTFNQRRSMPRRASKESSLQKIKRRTISKPTKHVNRSLEFNKLRPADIKRIYTNQKLTKFRPSNLETIYEEPPSTSALRTSDNDIEETGLNIDLNQVRFVGAKKLKRSMSCCDGLNINKALMKKRRAKIQKTFGRRFALKKIPLNEFLERLNKNIDETKSEEDKFLIEVKTDAEIEGDVDNKPSALQNTVQNIMEVEEMNENI